MPRGSPFTALCQQTARHRRAIVADLHTHTTFSDGDYTPSQILTFARNARLSAVAITDHDTLTVPAVTDGIRVITGVEMSGELDGRETHIVGLFLRPDCGEMLEHLADVCRRRRDRFRSYLQTLELNGTIIPNGLAEAVEARTTSLGRRHIATLLLQTGIAKSRYDAFRRFLHPLTGTVTPSHLTPAADVIRMIRTAGGVAVLAHPPRKVTEAGLRQFHHLGGRAAEVVFPAAPVGHTQRLRGLCNAVGLVVSGGSDCHGPEPAGRAVGSHGITKEEFDALEAFAGSPG